MDEFSVLIDQIDELLTGGVEDEEDAMELAVVAGQASRLEGDPMSLVDVESWRDSRGAALLNDAWNEVELEALVEEVDSVSVGGDAHAVEEALFDFDEIVAAAVWSRKTEVVRSSAKMVAAIIRQLPDVFASASDTAVEIVRSKAVAENMELYDFWFAVCEAAQWADND